MSTIEQIIKNAAAAVTEKQEKEKLADAFEILARSIRGKTKDEFAEVKKYHQERRAKKENSLQRFAVAVKTTDRQKILTDAGYVSKGLPKNGNETWEKKGKEIRISGKTFSVYANGKQIQPPQDLSKLTDYLNKPITPNMGTL